MGTKSGLYEIEIGYRGAKRNPLTPLAKTLESEDDLAELGAGINECEIKAVYAKNPYIREFKGYIFPGNRDHKLAHHCDIFLHILDEWGICPVDIRKKSKDAPLKAQIEWAKALMSEVPQIKKPFAAFVLGFKGKCASHTDFQMKSEITGIQVDYDVNIDREVFYSGVEWMKKIAERTSSSFTESDFHKELEVLVEN